MDLQKKIIRVWDGGIKTSTRDNTKNTSDGAQVISHFDIYKDANRLVPMPSWTPFTTEAEKAYGIRAMGGFSDMVYGLGKGLMNWYASGWAYREKVTVNNSLYTATGIPLKISLASMPAGFWSHVNSDGSDIRVTNSSNIEIAHSLDNFNYAGNTGELWIPASLTVGTTDYVYVYYGNPTATAQTDYNGTNYLNQPKDAWILSAMRFGFSFAGNTVNNFNTSEITTPTPTFLNGLFGKAINTGAVSTATLPAKQVALTGNGLTISLMIYVTALPPSSRTLARDGNNTWSVSLLNTGQIDFKVQGTGSTTITSAASLSVGQWYTLDCVFNNTYSIYINAVSAAPTGANGSYASNVTNNTVVINTQSVGYLAQVWGFSTNLSQAQVTTKYNNLTNLSFWSFGSEETFSSITPIYGGVQLYTKNISSGNWTEYLADGQPVKSASYYPVNGFIEQNGNIYFIVSDGADDTGFFYLGKSDGFQVIVPNDLTLSTLNTIPKIRPTVSNPVDQSFYFNYSTSSLGVIDTSNNVFAAADYVTSHIPWRNYLAIGSTHRNRAEVEIWDLVQANPIEFVDAGTGNLRIVGNASDLLFAVVDNYIDDAVLSSNQPTFELKQYVGNGRMDSVVKLAIPAVYTGWLFNWERAISFFKTRRNTETLFYAKLPTNSTATTFNQGLWAVGKNSRGNLALSTILDTTEFDTPENVFGFAQQVFYINHDGGIYRLATDGTYSKTSLFTTLLMNEGDTQMEKKLRVVELVTEPLATGQTYSVYYKADQDATRTKLFDFTGAGQTSYLVVNDPSIVNLPNYHEIQFDIESTGGKSAALELNYTYENLTKIK